MQVAHIGKNKMLAVVLAVTMTLNAVLYFSLNGTPMLSLTRSNSLYAFLDNLPRIFTANWTADNTSLRNISIGDVSGDVAVRSKSTGDYVPLTTDYEPSQGDMIVSSSDSYAYLKLDSDKEIFIDANTVLELAEVKIDGSTNGYVTRLKLHEGNVLSSVSKPLAEHDIYEVRTPTLDMAIRGTIVHVGYDKAAGSSMVAFLTGRGLIRSNDTGEIVALVAGEQIMQDSDGYVKGKLDSDLLPDYIASSLNNFDELMYNIETIDFSNVYPADSFNAEEYTFEQDAIGAEETVAVAQAPAIQPFGTSIGEDGSSNRDRWLPEPPPTSPPESPPVSPPEPPLTSPDYTKLVAATVSVQVAFQKIDDINGKLSGLRGELEAAEDSVEKWGGILDNGMEAAAAALNELSDDELAMLKSIGSLQAYEIAVQNRKDTKLLSNAVEGVLNAEKSALDGIINALLGFAENRRDSLKTEIVKTLAAGGDAMRELDVALDTVDDILGTVDDKLSALRDTVAEDVGGRWKDELRDFGEIGLAGNISNQNALNQQIAKLNQAGSFIDEELRKTDDETLLGLIEAYDKAVAKRDTNYTGGKDAALTALRDAEKAAIEAILTALRVSEVQTKQDAIDDEIDTLTGLRNCFVDANALISGLGEKLNEVSDITEDLTIENWKERLDNLEAVLSNVLDNELYVAYDGTAFTINEFIESLDDDDIAQIDEQLSEDSSFDDLQDKYVTANAERDEVFDKVVEDSDDVKQAIEKEKSATEDVIDDLLTFAKKTKEDVEARIKETEDELEATEDELDYAREVLENVVITEDMDSRLSDFRDGLVDATNLESANEIAEQIYDITGETPTSTITD